MCITGWEANLEGYKEISTTIWNSGKGKTMSSRKTSSCKSCGRNGKEKPGHKRFLWQEKYFLWYYNDRTTMSLYVCPNPYNV